MFIALCEDLPSWLFSHHIGSLVGQQVHKDAVHKATAVCIYRKNGVPRFRNFLNKKHKPWKKTNRQNTQIIHKNNIVYMNIFRLPATSSPEVIIKRVVRMLVVLRWLRHHVVRISAQTRAPKLARALDGSLHGVRDRHGFRAKSVPNERIHCYSVCVAGTMLMQLLSGVCLLSCLIEILMLTFPHL